MERADEWADLRGWLAELGAEPEHGDPPGAVALPLFRLVEPELVEKADQEMAERLAQIVRMMRYAGQRWDAPKMLEDAQRLEAETQRPEE